MPKLASRIEGQVPREPRPTPAGRGEHPGPPRREFRQANARSGDNRDRCFPDEKRLRPRARGCAAPKGDGFEAKDLELLSLVRRVAKGVRKRLPPHIELDDLVGEGVLGLLDALRKFDIRKHTRLETYARYRIRGAILDGLRSSDPVSRDLRKKSRQVEIARERLESALGRHAEDEEMGEALGISLKEWQATVKEISTAGFDWARLALAPGTLEFDEQNLPSPDQDTSFDLCYRREQKDILKALLASLPDRERIILRLYYTREMTMKGIAAILGIDESRVSQIHSAVIAKLRVRADAWVSNPRLKPPLVLPAETICAVEARRFIPAPPGSSKPAPGGFHPSA